MTNLFNPIYTATYPLREKKDFNVISGYTRETPFFNMLIELKEKTISCGRNTKFKRNVNICRISNTLP